MEGGTTGAGAARAQAVLTQLQKIASNSADTVLACACTCTDVRGFDLRRLLISADRCFKDALQERHDMVQQLFLPQQLPDDMKKMQTGSDFRNYRLAQHMDEYWKQPNFDDLSEFRRLDKKNKTGDWFRVLRSIPTAVVQKTVLLYLAKEIQLTRGSDIGKLKSALAAQLRRFNRRGQ